MADREKVIKGLECCILRDPDDKQRCSECPYEGNCVNRLKMDALSMLKAQEPRVMTLEEVEVLPYGYVLIETDKKNSLHWVDALLFCKNTNFSFDFITLEGRARLLGTDYNMEWRCWTSRPTDEQRRETPWSAVADGYDEHRYSGLLSEE